MSELEKYNGNFVNYTDREFNSGTPDHTLPFSNVEILDLQLSCNVVIVPSSTTFVEIFAEDIDEIKCYQKGNRLIIKQEELNNNINFNMNGNSISFSGNGSTIGRIFVDGQEINPNNSAQKKKPIQVIIHANHNMNLIANMSGASVLASKVVFKKSKIKIAGSSTVGIATASLKLEVSGQGNNYFVMKGGDLDLEVSGKGNVRIKGNWNDTNISVSGVGQIITEGICTGDYDASVSGMGRISHVGTISGHKRKDISGMGNISI
jgi:hypothetical protein